MDVCPEVALFFIHCSLDESCYELEHGTHFVEMFSFQHVSNFIVIIEPVQVSQNVSFREINVHGFVSAISADVRQEEATSSK